MRALIIDGSCRHGRLAAAARPRAPFTARHLRAPMLPTDLA
jgi:hypothetical protein